MRYMLQRQKFLTVNFQAVSSIYCAVSVKMRWKRVSYRYVDKVLVYSVGRANFGVRGGQGGCIESRALKIDAICDYS